jgi:hypothetical protein
VDLLAHEADHYARLTNTTALPHGQLAAHVRERSQTRSRALWEADLIVVVTWHSRSLDSLRAFPTDSGLVRFALLVRGDLKRCDRDVPDWLQPLVSLCEHLPNDDGRDSHSIAWFLLSYYHQLPRLLYFAQDDEGERKELRHVPRGDAFGAWLSRVEDDPFASEETCLCRIMVERWESAEQYGASYASMQLLFSLLSHNTSGVSTLRWPGANYFTLSARVARRVPRMFYGLLAELLRTSSHPKKGTQPALYVCNAAEALNAKRCRSPVDHAHMVERMLWLALDPHYHKRDTALQGW